MLLTSNVVGSGVFARAKALTRSAGQGQARGEDDKFGKHLEGCLVIKESNVLQDRLNCTKERVDVV